MYCSISWQSTSHPPRPTRQLNVHNCFAEKKEKGIKYSRKPDHVTFLKVRKSLVVHTTSAANRSEMWSLFNYQQRNASTILALQTRPTCKTETRHFSDFFAVGFFKMVTTNKRFSPAPHPLFFWEKDRIKLSAASSRLRLKCDGTRAETRFRLSAKRTSPFKSAWGVSSVDCWQPRCAHQR